MVNVAGGKEARITNPGSVTELEVVALEGGDALQGIQVVAFMAEVEGSSAVDDHGAAIHQRVGSRAVAHANFDAAAVEVPRADA